MASIGPIEQVHDGTRAKFGAKAHALSRLMAAGLPVPPGVCIAADAALEDIAAAYRRLGGAVAVRSSAAIEDGDVTSFAGQFETILDVSGESAVADAVQRVRASGGSARATAYRHAAEAASPGSIPVILQRHVRAERAGVLQTCDPGDGSAMLIEAAREPTAVTAGRATPSRLRLDRRSGAIRSGDAILSPTEARAIGELGLRIESVIGRPALVEWAIEGDQIWVLQARPATDIPEAVRAALRTEEIERLRRLAGPDGTTWDTDEFCATLELPTPMTWALLERMFAADGALGEMYADFGCPVDPTLGRLGAYDQIAGRPRLNRRRMQRMQFGDLPIYDAGTPLAHGIRLGRWLFRLPAILWRLRRRQRRIAEQLQSFPDRLERETIPAFERLCDTGSAIDTARLSDGDLLDCFTHWSRAVLIAFAREALKPATLAAYIVDDWRRRYGESEANRRAAAALQRLRLDARYDLAGALRALSAGKVDLREFLRGFGHRGNHEWELASERYSEQPPDIRRTDRRLPTESDVQPAQFGTDPPRAVLLRRLVESRELAKHVLLRGYAVLRALLLEMDRRWQLSGGVFYLFPEELPRVSAGENFSTVIADRRRRSRVWRSLFVPASLQSGDLERLGRPPTVPSSEMLLRGLPISPGTAQAPARVLTDPSATPSDDASVLVCPAADPAWTPHLLRARGAVFEVGGVLSHGAIVAREFGVPAVSGITDATRRIQSGQTVTVDGQAGTVGLADPATDQRR